MDRVKLKKIISNYYMERLTLDQCADEVLELFNVVELKQECPVNANVYPDHIEKNTLPDEWSVWCVEGNEMFDETVVAYLNNKYNSNWKAYPDRYYGETFIGGEYMVGISNIPFGRKLTFEEFHAMVIQETESNKVEVSKSNNTYPYSITYILKP